MCHILGKIRASSVSVLSFLGNWPLRACRFLIAGLLAIFGIAGSSVLRACRFLLNSLFLAFKRVGIGFDRWLRLAGVLIYAVNPGIILCSLLYAAIRFFPEQRTITWVVLLVSSFASFFWVFRWTRPQPILPRVIPIEHLVFFYLVSTFVLVVALFTCAYMAANMLGGGVSNFRTGVPLIGFWEYLQFSILTATTLGHNSITTKGISCVVECVEVFQFWVFVVILGVRLRPEEVA